MKHATRLRCRGQEFRLPQELEALADKSARTLATSLLGVLQTWLPPLLAALSEAAAGSRTELWFLHCLTGDAIPTNEAAAKILWAMRGTPPHPPLATSDPRTPPLVHHSLASSGSIVAISGGECVGYHRLLVGY